MKLSAVVALALIPAFGLAVQDEPRARGATTQNPPVSQVQGKGKTRPVAGEAGSTSGITRVPPPSSYNKNGATMSAQLVNPEEEAKERAAVVKVSVSGIQLVDPDTAGKTPHPGQGHLAYRVDMGPVVVTTATKLAFHELPQGPHRIVVELVANDGTPIGPHRVLNVTAP